MGSVDDLLRKPVQELSFDEIVRRSFHLYQARFVDFLVPFLVVGIANGTISAVMNFVGFLTYPIPPSRLDLSGLLELFVAVILLAIASWVLITIANGTAVKYSSDILEKGHARLDESFNFALSKLLSLLGSGILTSISIIIGLICLVVPGIILAIMFSLVVPAIIIEGTGALGSLGRSEELVSKRWGRTFAVLFIVLIIEVIASGIAAAISGPFGFVSSIVANVASAFVLPLLPITTTFLYYSMTAKGSGLVPSKVELTEKPKEPTTLTIRYCSQCGKPISPDADFCQNCGNKIR